MVPGKQEALGSLNIQKDDGGNPETSRWKTKASYSSITGLTRSKGDRGECSIFHNSISDAKHTSAPSAPWKSGTKCSQFLFQENKNPTCLPLSGREDPSHHTGITPVLHFKPSPAPQQHTHLSTSRTIWISPPGAHNWRLYSTPSSAGSQPGHAAQLL